MAFAKVKSEHAGAKNGDKTFSRAEAKAASKRIRREAAKAIARNHEL